MTMIKQVFLGAAYQTGTIPPSDPPLPAPPADSELAWALEANAIPA